MKVISLSCAAWLCCTASGAFAQIENGSFETGDFTGWTVSAPLASYPPLVVAAGYPHVFPFQPTTPSDGAFSMVTGWDQSGPGEAAVAQDVTLGPCDATLRFEWRADYQESWGDTCVFRVDVEPAGGGAPLARTVVHTIAPFSFVSTGMLAAEIDVSAFAGSTVRVSLETQNQGPVFGPSYFQMRLEVDHLRIDGLAASSTSRNGSGLNPAGFTELAGATVGGVWTTSVVLAAGEVGSTVHLGLGGATAGLVLAGRVHGEVLVAPPYTSADLVLGGLHAIALPADCALAGATLSAQAGSFSVAPFRWTLHNALDATVGTH